MSSSVFDYNLSISILVFVVLGGIGSIRGSIIAATVLTILPELLREILYSISKDSDISQVITNSRMLIYSVILIVMMIFNWSPEVKEWTGKFFGKFKKNKSGKKEVA